jgi:hypothetical protein
MPNFWDLPRSVRDKIYWLNLVHEGVIDLAGFREACGLRPSGVPLLLQLCERTEQEAAGTFFGENTFYARTAYETYAWKAEIPKRHFKLIRKFSVDGWIWPDRYGQGYTGGFRVLGSFKSLDTLTVTINEQEALERLLRYHSTIKWHKSLGLSPRLHLQALNFSGITGLRSLRNIQRIDFKAQMMRYRKATGNSEDDERGDIIGGFLDTTLRQEIARPTKLRT